MPNHDPRKTEAIISITARMSRNFRRSRLISSLRISTAPIYNEPRNMIAIMIFIIVRLIYIVDSPSKNIIAPFDYVLNLNQYIACNIRAEMVL